MYMHIHKPWQSSYICRGCRLPQLHPEHFLPQTSMHAHMASVLLNEWIFMARACMLLMCAGASEGVLCDSQRRARA